MRPSRTRPSGVAAVLAVAACFGGTGSGRDGSGAAEEQAVGQVTMAYECDAGASFVATVRRDTAWVFLPSGTRSLPPVETGPGTQYSDGTTTLRIMGEEATVETPAGILVGCRNNRARAAWEHAKLLGADFRAIGNEPGWILTIAPDSIVLVSDYGTTRHAFLTTPAEAEGRRTLYRTASGDRTLEVVLEAGGCRDTMSGEAFETRVTVALDGREMRGCGRPLH